MTRPDPLRPATPLTARRPPAPTGALASVTELGPTGAPREPVGFASVQGTLALVLDASPAPTPAPPRLRAVPGSDPAAPREVTAWAATFAQATVEVLGGDRPVAQLVRWTSERVYQDLERRARILGRAAPAGGRVRTVRPQVRSVHVFAPVPGVAEVSVHVRHGHRSRALAARLERHADGRWRCVALQLG